MLLVLCNPQKIQQAFMALLINAIEAMPDGGNIFIKINEESENIVIRIIDEGQEFPKKILRIYLNHFIQQKKLLKEQAWV